MGTNAASFVGSLPEIYDRFMVPLQFAPYAAALARRVAAQPVRDLLETAAGSGALTRALAPLLESGARYVATDLNPPMLAVARTRMPEGAAIDWQPADALDLPFPDASFDAVCCQFGVMFFPDRPKGYAEARRVLRPGGRFLFSVWDGRETNDFPRLVTEAVRKVAPEVPPFMARVPHGHGKPDTIRAELAAAGFAEIAIEAVTLTSRAPDAAIPATDLRLQPAAPPRQRCRRPRPGAASGRPRPAGGRR